MRRTSVSKLFKVNGERLALQHIGGDLSCNLSVSEKKIWPADLIGHLNLIHPDRAQVLGEEEIRWIRKQPQAKIEHLFNLMLAAHPPAMIVADGLEVPEIIRHQCQLTGTALFSSKYAAASVIDILRLYLSRELAETVSLHGVLMDVLGIGVFITADSGAGKSELALELISRGHGLVADDMVDFSRIAPTVLEGLCPPLLRNFLEVRGLGLLNIRTIFGEAACRRKMRLKLIVHLEKRSDYVARTHTRLPRPEATEILGVPIRKVILPVAAGRNIAVLLEAAVRNTILHLRGINTTEEFIERQRQEIERDGDRLGDLEDGYQQ